MTQDRSAEHQHHVPVRRVVELAAQVELVGVSPAGAYRDACPRGAGNSLPRTDAKNGALGDGHRGEDADSTDGSVLDPGDQRSSIRVVHEIHFDRVSRAARRRTSFTGQALQEASIDLTSRFEVDRRRPGEQKTPPDQEGRGESNSADDRDHPVGVRRPGHQGERNRIHAITTKEGWREWLGEVRHSTVARGASRCKWPHDLGGGASSHPDPHPLAQPRR